MQPRYNRCGASDILVLQNRKTPFYCIHSSIVLEWYNQPFLLWKLPQGRESPLESNLPSYHCHIGYLPSKFVLFQFFVMQSSMISVLAKGGERLKVSILGCLWNLQLQKEVISIQNSQAVKKWCSLKSLGEKKL